jgi:sugar phosphate isomerase/epimerase
MKGGHLAPPTTTKAPIRIGATSFVYPDRWLPNVERLVGRVDDVELLVFEAEPPDAAEQAALAALKRKTGLTYSLHTPLSISLASESAPRRHQSVALLRRIIEDTSELHPDLYVVHVYLGDCEADVPPRDLAAWRGRARRSLEAVLDSQVAPETLCVESLDYDFALLEPVVEELGLSVALDVGHLQRDGRPVREVMRRNLHRTRVIQWHGVDASGRDHRSLALVPRAEARDIVDHLLAESYPGVLTLEVFREDDFEESLAFLQGLIAEARP